MELPTLSEFKELLEEDNIFCDYLSAFLSLPVFAKRIIYHAKKKQFDIEPEINFTYHVLHEPRLLAWIHESRLPLFWHSELFYEYQLCSALVKSNKVVPAGNGHWFGSVSAMHHFRKFLFRTEGESAWMFWVDVENLKSTKEKFVAQKLISRIQHLYLQEGALFKLNEDLKRRVVLFFDRDTEASRKVSTPKKIELLVCGQNLAMEELRSYWCKRYVLHLQSSNNTQKSSSVSDQQNPQFMTIMSISEDDRKIRNQKQTFHLPRIIVDEGNNGANVQPKRASHIQLNADSLPSLNDGTSLCSAARPIPTKISTQLNTVQHLITPSTEALFSKSSHIETQQSSGSSSQNDSHLLPYLTASLRSDFMAHSPLLRYLKKVQSNRKAIDNLLFWQSVENILTQDEMRRWYFRKFEAEECPYLDFFEPYPVANNLKQLLHLYIKENAPHKIDLTSEARKELTVLLPKGLGQSLVLLVQERAAQVLLKPWKEYLLYDHLQFMKKCTTHKLLTRLASSITTEATTDSNPSPQLVTERLYSSSHLHCMWSALRFAEAAKYPGIYQLPSRRLTNVSLHKPTSRSLSDDGDSQSTTENDMEEEMVASMTTLAPMVTTVRDKMDWDWKENKHRQEILYITKPQHSNDFYNRKPKVPRSFLEVLKDREQLEYFRHYLFVQGVDAETPLQFWLAIEDLKSTIGNTRANSRKMRRIRERFLPDDASRALSGRPDSSVLSELSKLDKPNFFQLLAVQANTAAKMEKRWFTSYVAHLNNKDEEDSRHEEEPKPSCTENTKGLWGMFAHNVISFRRGLMSADTAEMFKKFLQDEVLRGNRGPSRQKKLIGTKVVNVTKLLNDLAFWAEVERYKDLADMVKAGKEKGTHTPEDDILVHKKAHAIVNCFIDSAVSPKVQINVSNELVGIILDNISQGLITRGLFHEAALNIFSILILYWKKFCVTRFAPNRRGSVMSVTSCCTAVSVNSMMRRQKFLNDLHSVSEEQKESREWHGFFGDGGPILSYSLSYGLRWSYYPGHPNLPAAYHHGGDRTTILS